MDSPLSGEKKVKERQGFSGTFLPDFPEEYYNNS